jgi:hypothetical protein
LERGKKNIRVGEKNAPFNRWEDTFYTKIIITRHSTCSLVLPVPKDSNFGKRRRTLKNKSKQTKEIKLMPPVCFLNQIFKLGVT